MDPDHAPVGPRALRCAFALDEAALREEPSARTEDAIHQAQHALEAAADALAAARGAVAKALALSGGASGEGLGTS